MIRKIPPGELSEIQEIFDDFVRFRKGTQYEISESTIASVTEAQEENKIQFLAKYRDSRPVGFVMFTPGENRINLFHILDTVSDRHQIERELLDEALSILSETCEQIRASGPSIGSDLSAYIIERGFQKFSRKNMNISRERIDALPEPSVPEGYQFDTYGPEMTDSVAELIFQANVGELDVQLYPEYFGSKEGANGLLVELEEYDHRPFSKVLTWDGNLIGVLLLVKFSDKAGHISEVSIGQDHRRKGFGRNLLIYGFKEMVGVLDTLESVTLDFTVGNPAEKLYESLGFEVQREYSSFIWKRI